MGYHVHSFTESKKALEAFQEMKDQVDLVISNIVMPVTPGHKLALEMLSIKPDLPIILTTGYIDIVDANEMIDLGVKKVLSKPIIIEELALAISEVLKEE
ncbi:MAG: hypothetical protein OMM_07677 [Candidatus Magnetoglobus multicellularis str. Araruama]|uniref:Response regulatory domain-containing protein n=1 Tax=Candidatus Magnetoglobus multicellularis str. Araruama TaxID=890399 RepID=A0A1V1PBK0_9BACT|nr:MAG: hypothetical protein OMM_07677 [Candidatus Magnetoglobus multicellularis str. Araruama]